ncbi:DNRLRE domain-containing protein, partial [bacterium]|nr:DNRLRE domain-containing protein [bacterium]
MTSRILCTLSVTAALTAFGTTVNRSQSCMILTRDPLCWSNYNGAAQTGGQYPQMSASGGSAVGGMLLMQFDLSGFAGQTCTQDATFTIKNTWSDTSNPTYPFEICPVISNWDAATVTWKNWIGDTLGTTFRSVLGPVMQTLDVPSTNAWPGVQSYFVVSQSVIQAWLDDPSANHGIALVPATTYCNFLWFSDAATWRSQTERGQLIFTSFSSGATPAPPGGVWASDGEFASKVWVRFNPSTAATKYAVYRNTVNNSGTAANISGDITATEFYDTTAPVNQPMYYWVRAGNASGWSVFGASDTGQATNNGTNDTPVKVILMGGQSNMKCQHAKGTLPASLQSPQADVKLDYFVQGAGDGAAFTRTLDWIDLQCYTGYIYGYQNNNYGPEITCGRGLADELASTHQLAIMKFAVDGARIFNNGGSAVFLPSAGKLYTVWTNQL